MATTNAAFKAGFAALMQRTGADAQLLVRRVALDFQRALVLRSPVDTGRFRANWVCGLGAVNADTSRSPSAQGAAVVAQTAAELQNWQLGQTIYLTNSMPYARRLEYGWSAQQPQGMVRVTVAEYTQRLSAQVANLKGRA